MSEQKHPGGRPLKYTLEEMVEKIDAYFAKCDAEDEPYTVTGLALALGTDRKTLINYENRDEFFHTIKTAKTRVENYAEKKLYGNNATGPIFALKNFDWSDKREVDNKTDMKVEGAIGVFSPPEMSKEEWMEYMRGNRNQDRKPKP